MLAMIDPQEINSQVDALRAQMAGAQARLESARKNSTFQQQSDLHQYRCRQQNAASAKARLGMAEAEAKGAAEAYRRRAFRSRRANLDTAASKRRRCRTA